MKTFTYTLRLIRYRPWTFAANCGLWLLYDALPLLTGLVIRALFERMEGLPPAGLNLWTLVAMLAGIEATRFGSFVYAWRVFIDMWHTNETLLRRNLLEWALTAAGPRMMEESPSESVTRFRDDVSEISNWIEMLVDTIGIVVFTLSAFYIMFRIHALITVLVSVPLILTLVLGSRISRVIGRYRVASRNATGRVTEFIGEVFGAVQAIQVASAEEPAIRRFGALNEKRRTALIKDAMAGDLYYILTDNMVDISVAIVLFLSASAMRAGEFSIGDFALFVSYLSLLSQNLRHFGSVITQYRRVTISIERLDSFLQDAPPGQLVAHAPVYTRQEPPALGYRSNQEHEPLHLLEIRNLTVHHQNGNGGIHDASLEVARGELVVITGRIGSGKSTLLRGVLGLIPSSGEILWNGRPILDPSAFFRPPISAYTAQVPRLFSGSLRDNIVAGEKVTEESLEAALHRAVLETDIGQLEKGLETSVGNRGVRLSGGQSQRVAAARMFVREHELLIMDDLSSALDIETERLLWERMACGRDNTCIVVSHRPEILERADRIVLLKEGRVEGIGTLADLLATSDEMRRIYSSERLEQE
jgi:ATP-binding cassette, subfamily B, bacterial